MKKIEQIKQTEKTDKKKTTKTLFSVLSEKRQESIFEVLFSAEMRSGFKFVKPVLSSNGTSAAFFDADLSAAAIKTVTDGGFTTDELKSIDNLSDYGIVAISEKSEIIDLIGLPNKVHELRYWIKDSGLNIYCQVGSRFSLTKWSLS